MAELTPSERLQPCLLDRLTDDDPRASDERRDMRVVSLQRYRRAVLRDLTWLLNTSCHTEEEEFAEFEEAENSVVNYGVPDVCGLSIGAQGLDMLERRMIQAIRRFEPRIIESSLVVRAILDEKEMSPNALTFEIRADLWAQPACESLYVKTEVDLETGRYQLSGSGGV